MREFIIIAVASIFVCLQSAYSQISTNELPVSIQRGLDTTTKDKTIGTIDLPVPDIKILLQEDSLNQEKNPNVLQRTAVSIPVAIDINRDGIWSTLEDGGRLWQMEIHAEKALALDFVFSKFWLPKKGKFFFFNSSTKETIGAITSKYLLGDKNKPHRFSTGILKGDKIILEYYQPAGEKELPIIKVEKAYYTYIPAPNFLSTSTCNYEVNVNCSESSNWQLEKNAVALVYCKYDNGSGWCSGSLVNNTQNNMAPLFLTANHCMGTKDATGDNDLSDWVFYWDYELENCSSTTQPNYYNNTTVGATLLANNSYSDFALLQLQQDPLDIPGYNPYYLGWDASGCSETGGVCIHHPNCDVKKISTYSCTPQTVSYDSSPSVYWGVQWIATANGHGITEPGSSGSPLINNKHRVIGQLAGGNTSCTNLTGTDYYGKLSVSWTGNGNSDYRRRLNYWLDPNGNNTQNINGICLYISGSSVPCDNSVYSVSNLPSGYTVTWSWQNPFGSILQQNMPSTNMCTLDKNGYDYINNTIVATIRKNGTPLCTLTKPVDTGQNFSGYYAQAAHQYTYWNYLGTTNTSFGSGDTIYLFRGSTITLTSSKFVGATLTYSGTTPYGWTHNGNTVSFNFSFFDINDPISPRGVNYIVGPALLTITGTYPNSCECFEFTVIGQLPLGYMLKSGGSPDVGLDISSQSGQTYSISCDAADGWELSVIDFATGKTVFVSYVEGAEKTLDTTGWKSGIYIVKATVGNQVQTQKLSVKK